MDKKRNIFNFSIVVSKADIDELNHVNNNVYLKWINQAATKHWAKLSDSKFDKEFSWVALRHEIDYIKPAFLNDVITVKTWVGDTGGVKSTRYVEIYKDKLLITKGKTVWVMLDAKTMRPKRIGKDVLSVLKSD